MKTTNPPLIILDNGHGNNTPGKRSPVWKDGTQLFEYEFNRDIVCRVANALKCAGINHLVLVPEINDISLPERIKRVNKHKNSILISIHANAGGGTGFEIFTSPGETASDPIATIFCEECEKEFPEFKMRFDWSDGDPDKEANFYMLVKSSMPAILTENLFMDTKKDCDFLMSEEGRERIAKYHVKAIDRVLKELYP